MIDHEKKIWNDEDKKAASKALQVLAVIKALCGEVPGGNYVDEELLKEVVSDMADEPLPIVEVEE